MKSLIELKSWVSVTASLLGLGLEFLNERRDTSVDFGERGVPSGGVYGI